MRLTPELFEQITGCKVSALERTRPDEEEDPRLAARLPLAFKATACRFEGDQYHPPMVPVHVCDISRLGVGLSHGIEFKLGKRFIICFKKPGPLAQIIPIQCEVMTRETIGKTQVRLGASFVASADAEAVYRAAASNAQAAHTPKPPPPPQLSHKPLPAPQVVPHVAQPAQASQPALGRPTQGAPVGSPSRPPVPAGNPGDPPPDALLPDDEVKRIRDAMFS